MAKTDRNMILNLSSNSMAQELVLDIQFSNPQVVTYTSLNELLRENYSDNGSSTMVTLDANDTETATRVATEIPGATIVYNSIIANFRQKSLSELAIYEKELKIVAKISAIDFGNPKQLENLLKHNPYYYV